MSKIESLKLEMLDYIRSYMVINSMCQSDIAKVVGVSQPSATQVLGGRSGITPVISIYLAIGGELSGTKESKEKLVELFLNGRG